MLGILANDPPHALALAVAPNDEAAVFADGLAGWTNFHERWLGALAAA